MVSVKAVRFGIPSSCAVSNNQLCGLRYAWVDFIASSYLLYIYYIKGLRFVSYVLSNKVCYGDVTPTLDFLIYFEDCAELITPPKILGLTEADILQAYIIVTLPSCILVAFALICVLESNSSIVNLKFRLSVSTHE